MKLLYNKRRQVACTGRLPWNPYWDTQHHPQKCLL